MAVTAAMSSGYLVLFRGPGSFLQTGVQEVSPPVDQLGGLPALHEVAYCQANRRHGDATVVMSLSCKYLLFL